MTIEIKIPTLPESVSDATIAAWRVEVGEYVSQDDILVDVETDKIVLEVPAPENGKLVEILHTEGDTVMAEQLIARFEEGTDEQTSSTTTSTNVASSDSEIIDIQIPTLPESVADASIALWRVQAGDQVSRDDVLVDIETDKIVLEVPAPEDGTLIEIVEQEGSVVQAHQLIARFQCGTAAVTKPVESTSSSSVDKEAQSDKLSPSVRRFVAEHPVDVSDIEGTGVGNRITKQDVQEYLRQDKPQAKKEVLKQPVSEPAVSHNVAQRGEKRVPMSRLRQKIAQRLLEAKTSTAMLTTFNEVNMKPIMDLRKRYKDEFEKRHDVRLGFMSFYVKAVTEALKRFPEVNASIDGNDIVYHNFFDISIAVSTPRGLVTPVLRDCNTLSFSEIEKRIHELAAKGRDGKLTVDDLTGGNFTITNGGVFGSMMSTPILNPPQSAILGMHAIKDRPMAVDGKVEILPMMYLALSYDHRIIDGKESVSFLVAIKEMLEDPTRLLLDI